MLVVSFYVSCYSICTVLYLYCTYSTFTLSSVGSWRGRCRHSRGRWPRFVVAWGSGWNYAAPDWRSFWPIGTSDIASCRENQSSEDSSTNEKAPLFAQRFGGFLYQKLCFFCLQLGTDTTRILRIEHNIPILAFLVPNNARIYVFYYTVRWHKCKIKLEHWIWYECTLDQV